MKIDMISIGTRIKQRRKELHLTQTDVFNRCGISSGALSPIENGTRIPTIAVFYSIAQALECSMDWLMTGNSTNTKNPTICEVEDKFVKHFHELSPDDKEEILALIQFKLDRQKKERKKDVSSSLSPDQLVESA